MHQWEPVQPSLMVTTVNHVVWEHPVEFTLIGVTTVAVSSLDFQEALACEYCLLSQLPHAFQQMRTSFLTRTSNADSLPAPTSTRSMAAGLRIHIILQPGRCRS